MFYRWGRHLPDDVALVPLRLPGRDDRWSEPPYTDLATLADEAAAAISSLEPRPSLFVGHSLGGYVALEVTRRLLGTTYAPSKLIVAACGAPREGTAKLPIGHLPDAEFVEEVARRYDGIPSAVRENAELLKMVLPPLRADIQMIESYDYLPAAPLAIDILALGGTDDMGVPAHRLNEWRGLTSAKFQMRLLPGGHFFLHPPARREAAVREQVPAALTLIIDSLPSAGASEL
jgi:medium-chain acyl-[acyl-carrier-protein] hydrolase